MLDWDEWVKASGLEKMWKRAEDLDYMDGDDINVFTRMKFAEYIIKECVQVADQHCLEAFTRGNSPMDVGRVIGERFRMNGK